jgi:serine/threonine protein kinase
VDYWALGILIYEMHYGIDPFSSEDPLEVYRKILENKIKFGKGFDRECKSIVGKLVETDLTRRYGNLKNGVSDIKEHKFFRDVEWTSMEG